VTAASAVVPRRRGLAFALVAAGCALGIAAWAGRDLLRARSAEAAVDVRTIPMHRLPTGVAIAGRPYVLVRHAAPGPDHGRLALAFIAAADAPRRVAPLACERVHYAAGAGICLAAHRGAATTYEALLFDDDLRVRARLPLAGPPSRARVSPDGRLAAFTTFVVGHAYGTPGFSTRTAIVDARTGAAVVADLERWPVVRDGEPFRAADFNFWGVTFDRDGDRFLATLGSGGTSYLVEGRLSRRALRVLARGVECPSLSPDGRRVAFKQRDARAPAGRLAWRLAVMTLASGEVRVLPGEARSVDDQPEWNGDRELLYAMPDDDPRRPGAVDVWAVAVDGDAPARRMLAFAASPAVVATPSAGARDP
jgi:dipeptidyl aminopeptidase/acylaminoacyl peptidase